MKKKIIITTYFFPPDNTPRAFRAIELAKYFSKQGLDVEVFTPDNDHDYAAIEDAYGIKVVKVKRGLLINKFALSIKDNASAKGEGSKLGFLKKLASYFIGNKDIEYAYTLSQALKEQVGSYDYIVANSLPFSVVLGTGLFINHRKPTKKAIAEYGDPYYYSPHFKKFIVHKYLEKWALRQFDDVTITTEKILKYFTPLKGESSIHVIPQGFDFSQANLSPYERHSVPTFAYAGIFYERERDPTGFLEYLVSQDTLDFRFYVLTDLLGKVGNGFKLIEPFIEKLGPKLVLNDLIPRDECVYELSKMDFLINIETANASPSKLIDYKLAGRPVLEIDKKDKYKMNFQDFIKGDYTHDLLKNFDLSKFDINTVGRRFMELLNS